MLLIKKNCEKNSSVKRKKQNRLILLSNCAIYDKKMIKTHQKSRSKWTITPLSNIPLIGDILL